MGPRRVGGPKFRAFSSLSATVSFSLCLSGGRAGALKCTRLGSWAVVCEPRRPGLVESVRAAWCHTQVVLLLGGHIPRGAVPRSGFSHFPKKNVERVTVILNVPMKCCCENFKRKTFVTNESRQACLNQALKPFFSNIALLPRAVSMLVCFFCIPGKKDVVQCHAGDGVRCPRQRVGSRSFVSLVHFPCNGLQGREKARRRCQ